MLKVITLFVFVTVIQSKTLDVVSKSYDKNEASRETLPLYVDSFKTLQKPNENDKDQLDVLISDFEAMQQEMIGIVNKELVDLEKLVDSNLKIDKELVKKLIANTSKLLNAMMRVGGAILAIVKDVVPI